MKHSRFVPIVWPSNDRRRAELVSTLSEHQIILERGRLDLDVRELESNDLVLLIDPSDGYFLKQAWVDLQAEVKLDHIYWYCECPNPDCYQVLPFKCLYNSMKVKGKKDQYLTGFGGTCLIWASRYNDSKAVQKMIEEGARDKPDVLGITAVYESAMHGYMDILQQLIRSRAQVDHVILDGSTPLIQAVWVACCLPEEAEKFSPIPHYCQVVRMLVDAGADIHACDGWRKRPRNYATDDNIAQQLSEPPEIVKSCAACDFEKLCSVLESGLANPNARDAWQWSALHYAAYHGQAQIVRKFLEATADTSLRCNWGFTALEWAEFRGHTDVAASLPSQQGRVGHTMQQIVSRWPSHFCAVRGALLVALLAIIGCIVNHHLRTF